MKISPKGTSMLPFLKEGRDSVLVVPDMPKKYDIALYEKNGVYVLHRVLEVTPEGYITCGDNSCVHEKVEKSKVIGRVNIVLKNSRPRHAGSLIEKLCAFFWHKARLKLFYRKFLKIRSDNKCKK